MTRQDGSAARRVTRFWPLVTGGTAVLLAVILGLMISRRSSGRPLEIDTEWMAEIVEHRSPMWLVPALVMNYLGGGVLGVVVVPLGVLAALLLFRRPWAALYFVIAEVSSAGLVQLLKVTFGRARPGDIIVQADFGSFPSGHVANAATMALALAIIFPRVWMYVLGIVYSVLMMLSRTYLGAHWLTDTVGGLLLGAGVGVIVWAPLAARLEGEAHSPHPFVLVSGMRGRPTL